MTLKVLVVDDESLARSRMKSLPPARVTGEAAESAQALALNRCDRALKVVRQPARFT